MDIGATDHKICSAALFTSIKAKLSHSVALPNGNVASVTHIGTVKITETLVLEDVLCVPSFSFNLILARKLTQTSKCCLIFSPQSCFEQDLSTWKTTRMGEVRQVLYHLLQRNVSPTTLDEALSSLRNKSNISVLLLETRMILVYDIIGWTTLQILE